VGITLSSKSACDADGALANLGIWHEAQLSQRDPRDAVSVETWSYYCMNNANGSRVRSTFSNCHFLFSYLHSFVQSCIVAV